METATVTVRRLARELGIDRQTVSKYLNRSPVLKLGTREGARGLLTEREADKIRVALGKRLELPTRAEVASELGQRVYGTVEAAAELGLCEDIVRKYGHDLGVLIQIRNGIMPSYVISADGVAAIWEARESTKERLKEMLRNQAKRASQIGARTSQHRALMREDIDYYGRIVAYRIEPVAVDDPELTSETGPEMRTHQWVPFYVSCEPNMELDTRVWYVSDHRQHFSLERMREEELKRGTDRF